jgi:hypothetical protein
LAGVSTTKSRRSTQFTSKGRPSREIKKLTIPKISEE